MNLNPILWVSKPKMQITKRDIKTALQAAGPVSSDFDLNTDVAAPPPQRVAGVLVPLVQRAHGIDLILTKRAAHLKSHPGQISFPGGKQEKTDTNIAQTALREAWEEVGLPPKSVELMGQLPNHNTVTSFAVTPVVGWISDEWQVQIDPGEVDEVFSVPFEFVMNTSNYQIQGRWWQGGLRRYYTVPYGPYYIWGATARMLYGMAKGLK